ncbi:hypothetical protein BV25DRAFT_1915379 [Artomyces pyxidatus]|uniref:Uncharacterized protein n=1 Tax=Artomyces pyxidatus TaxID=48021 RepID=A0ACB8T578_9AGAM|nr:hypothetical protein BV25DRAFT_1915379 [Artomyces pyxidatus]
MGAENLAPTSRHILTLPWLDLLVLACRVHYLLTLVETRRMITPRLVPGDEPGCFIVYLMRPGDFEFTLVPRGGAHSGLLRLSIVNIATIGGADGYVQDAIDPPPRAPSMPSSQTSSPVPTSQPDWDLPILVPRSSRCRSYSEPSKIAAAGVEDDLRPERPPAAARALCRSPFLPSASDERSSPPALRTVLPVEHPPAAAGPSRRSRSPRSPSDTRSSSPALSALLDALQELYPNHEHLEAAIIR